MTIDIEKLIQDIDEDGPGGWMAAMGRGKSAQWRTCSPDSYRNARFYLLEMLPVVAIFIFLTMVIL